MTNTMITLTDLYDIEELAAMSLEEIRDILYDIFGNYADIKKDAFTTYMKALTDTKKS